MSIATLPASLPFLTQIAREWLARVGMHGGEGEASGMILVPSRRAARALREAFLRVLDGRAALLPTIAPLGDLEEETLFSMALEKSLPPAVESTRRLVTLSQLILAAPMFRASPESGVGALERVWPLAQALAQLMDEAERAGVDLAEALPEAVVEDHAEHWQQTLNFLEIVTKYWPAWLAEEGLSNPVARQVGLLQAQAGAWRVQPPEGPLWAVGFVDGAGGITELLGAVAALPEGRVILQGVDLKLPETLWEALPEAHPQAMFRDLLAALETTRAQLEVWEGEPSGERASTAREGLLRQVMLPEQGLLSWGQQRSSEQLAQGLEGLSVLHAEDTQQEAQTIALALRDIAETPGRTGALITPDLGLARRVSAELLRFGIHADNSAGEPLSGTPAAVFLRLVADAAAEQLSPVALLAVLKHPLAALGMGAGKTRASARLLERVLLRGPAPPPGIGGLRKALEEAERNRLARQKDEDLSPEEWGRSADAPDSPESVSAFLDRIEHAFAPLLELKKDVETSLPDLLDALVRTGEALATTPEELAEGEEDAPGQALWRGDDGRMLSRHLAELMAHGEALPGQRLGGLEAFLAVSMAGKSLTGLRGHLQGVELAHPRISILGVLEARLMAFDTAILGALTEASWPPATDPGPWMSRPMRRRIGLASPERRLGASAHDFLTAVLGSGKIILSAPGRRDGSPAVRARWLVRLEAYLAGQKEAPAVAIPPALSWQRQLDRPVGASVPVRPPKPRPPLALRPRRLSITEIDTLKCDPYAIYARHVLKLRALAPLEEGVEHADYGMIVHAGLEDMFRRFPTHWPAKALQHLEESFETALKAQVIRPALVAWWRPRLERIAAWVVGQELAARDKNSLWTSHSEVKARYVLQDLPGGSFTLTGRADRIDLRSHDPDTDGPDDTATLRARVFDYKTGAPPSQSEVAEGWASQMVLEAAMLARGHLEKLDRAQTQQLVYWHLSGGAEPGKEITVPGKQSKIDLDALVGSALDNLAQLIRDYDDPRRPYLSQPWAAHAPRYTDYAQLARVSEWRSGGNG